MMAYKLGILILVCVSVYLAKGKSIESVEEIRRLFGRTEAYEEEEVEVTTERPGCRKLWDNHCNLDEECCTNYCWRGNPNWKYGVCKIEA